MRRHGLRARIRQQRRLFQRLATRHALARRGYAGVRMLEAIGEWIDERSNSVRFVPPLADILLAPAPRVIDAPAELADSMLASDATSDTIRPSPPEPFPAAEARTGVRPQHHAAGSQPSAQAHGEPGATPPAAALVPNDVPYAKRPVVAAEAQPSGARDDSAALRGRDQLLPAAPVAVTTTMSAGSEPPHTATAAAPNAGEASAALPPTAAPPAPPASEHDMVVQRALAALRKSGELPTTRRTTVEPPPNAVDATSTRSARPAPDLERETTSSPTRPADAGEVLAAPEQAADAAPVVVSPSRGATQSFNAERSDTAERATRVEVATVTSATTPPDPAAPAPAAPAPTAPAPTATAEVEPTGTGRIDERRQARRPVHLPANRAPSGSGPDAMTTPNVPSAPPQPSGSGAARETSGQFQFTDVGRTPQEWRQLLIEALRPPTARSARAPHATRVEPPPSGARSAPVAATPAAPPFPAKAPASRPVPTQTPARTPPAPVIAEPRGTSAGVRRVPPAVPSLARKVPQSGSDRVPAPPAAHDVRHTAEHPRHAEPGTSGAGSDTSTTDASMPDARAPRAAPPNAPEPGERAAHGRVSDTGAAPAGSTRAQLSSPVSAPHERSDVFVADGHARAPGPIDQSGEVPASIDRPTGAPRTVTDAAEQTDEQADVWPRAPQTVPATANRAGGAPPRSARAPEPLSPSARRFLQPLVGIDPDTVRIHRDEHATRIAAAHDADAVAVGDEIELGAGHDDRDPATIALVAHELTHVARARTHRFVPPVARGSWSPRHAPPALGATSVRGMDATTASASPSPADEETVARVTEARVHDAAARERAVSVTTVVEPDIAGRVPDPGRQAAAHRHPLMSTEAAAEPASPNAGIPHGRTRGSEDPWGGLPAPWEPLPAFLTDERQRVVSPSAAPEAPGAPNGRATADPAPVVAHRAERGLGRAGEEPAHAEPPTSADAAGPDLDTLARQVYDVLRRRLAAERRRGA